MKISEGTTPNELAVHLLGDERIIWWGRPTQGIKLASRDLFLILFSCLWCEIAIFWETNVLRIWINSLDPTPRFIGIGDAERVFAMVQTGAQSNLSSANSRQRPASGYRDVTA